MFTIKTLTTGAAMSLLLISSVVTSGCSDKKDNPDAPVVESKDIDINASNIKSWTNYMVQVSYLLKTDADNLLSAWTTSYNGGRSFAESFKNFSLNEYPSAVSCTEEIIDKMAEIANEVGQAKIGDPYALYIANRREEALYAVESWYSWHSRDDYTNNIYSIRNAYFGSLNGSVTNSSLSSLIKAVNPELDKAVSDAITKAATSIQAIQQPFRNNIPGTPTLNAMEACAELEDLLNNQLKPFAVTLPESDLTKMVALYVDNVVIPTYTALSRNTSLLNEAVKTLAANPNNDNFEKACRAWMPDSEQW
ncbi:MAG: peptidase M75, partial [Paramuribaculum sp.]|nr:peptidase M75 [Paramuribaculum sp.]